MISTVFVGRGFMSVGTSDAAGIRSGRCRPNLTPRIHSSLDPSCRLMSICPEGTLTEAVERSSPEGGRFLLLVTWWSGMGGGKCREWFGGRIMWSAVVRRGLCVVNPFGLM